MAREWSPHRDLDGAAKGLSQVGRPSGFLPSDRRRSWGRGLRKDHCSSQRNRGISSIPRGLMLMRHPTHRGETLAQLLTRLDQAIDKAPHRRRLHRRNQFLNSQVSTSFLDQDHSTSRTPPRIASRQLETQIGVGRLTETSSEHSTQVAVRWADSRRERFVRPQPVAVKVGSFH
jgi:hypothetical protein